MADLGDDGQPQPGALRRLAVRAPAAEAPPGQRRALLVAHPGTVVEHGELEGLVLRLEQHRHVTAGSAVADRVGDEVVDHPLERERPTEVEFIQGEIVALADKLGRDAPIARRLVQLVKAAEQGGKRQYKGEELYRAITQPTA